MLGAAAWRSYVIWGCCRMSSLTLCIGFWRWTYYTCIIFHCYRSPNLPNTTQTHQSIPLSIDYGRTKLALSHRRKTTSKSKWFAINFILYFSIQPRQIVDWTPVCHSVKSIRAEKDELWRSINFLFVRSSSVRICARCTELRSVHASSRIGSLSNVCINRLCNLCCTNKIRLCYGRWITINTSQHESASRLCIVSKWMWKQSININCSDILCDNCFSVSVEHGLVWHQTHLTIESKHMYSIF